MNKGKYFWGIGFAVLLLALFVIPRLTNPNNAIVAAWSEAGIECLINGHTRLSQHFHPVLKITVDGLDEAIPANVGLLQSCMAEVHTHDTSGILHVESASGDKKFYLKDFLTVYGKSFRRPGYNVGLRVDGKLNVDELENLELKDKQQIEIFYISE